MTPFLAWSVVFYLNLPVCLLLGWGITNEGGWAGMCAGIALLFSIGWWVCSSFPRLGRAVNSGGFLLGFAQFVPVAQVLAGYLGLSVAEKTLAWKIGHLGQQERLLAETFGLLATLVTGTVLILVAILIGMPINWILAYGSKASSHQGGAKKPIPDDLHELP